MRLLHNREKLGYCTVATCRDRDKLLTHNIFFAVVAGHDPTFGPKSGGYARLADRLTSRKRYALILFALSLFSITVRRNPTLSNRSGVA